MPDVSIIVPSRNEPYLWKTVKDLLQKSQADIEVIVILDGYWPNDVLVNDERVIIIHNGTAKGMRGAINQGVTLSKGKYILKTDSHCMFDEGYDKKLIENCDSDWVVVPRRYSLDPENWEILDNPKYPVDYMYLSIDMHGRIWNEKNKDKNLEKILIDENMSSQGSAWFMEKKYYNFLELEDEENYGSFSNEFQEIGLKAWLSGGKVMTNKNTWYAHYHKTKGRGYSLNKTELIKGEEFTKRWKTNTAWHKQRHPFNWLIEKFWPVPTWPEDNNLWI